MLKKRVVRNAGNPAARNVMFEVFDVTNSKWHGIGEIPMSGYSLKPDYAELDAEIKFGAGQIEVNEPEECISGIVLQGLKKPNECAAFGTLCTPEHPLGATMVSAEGACAAYYTYARHGKVKVG